MLGIKCTKHSHCYLWSSHCQKKFPLPVKKVPTVEEKQCNCCEDCTATKVKKKLVKRSEWELKARTPHKKIHKVDRGRSRLCCTRFYKNQTHPFGAAEVGMVEVMVVAWWSSNGGGEMAVVVTLVS
nr:hypothetical protein [Tanacetum cinerariifolium]